ncbi:hypothetical protein PR202_gb22639 [Eleusine coracana subsp. coracana]|uniref:ZF-HD dimerization-type domain-containing protein n=1 Tax=Eleusine coracana subsp. coracana TaxID=191504 RepID=A0AAV5FGP1_ELECO|nr:hypothetical protein QOZ80_6BG0488360 [Eleusine coracana subsp. coracana]GJN34008.1 hypothetical protein PR202_gb22639 [Eleusine coracana subsp. coracana]
MEAMDIKYKTAAFPNGGAAKKVKPAAVVAGAPPMYRECLKNHAASLGGHAVDGCGEFMASPAANPADPSSLKCAACGCHRNFHRRAVDGGSSPPAALPAPLALPAPVVPPPAGAVLHGHPPPPLQQRREDTPEDRLPAVVDGDEDDSTSDSDASEYDEERSVSPPPPQLLHHVPAPVAHQPPPPPAAAYYHPSGAPHMMLSLGSGAPGMAAAQRLPAGAQLASPASAPPGGGAPARKRFRTKFTAEQKQRMQELSERLGWRLQKRDEAIVDEWCRDIGVGKGVFKVWMHNNKHNFLGGHSARRSASASVSASAAPLLSPAGGSAPPPFHSPTGASAPPPFHSPTSGSAPPPFHPSAAASPPPPPVLSSSPPSGFININGNAAASCAPTAPAAGHQQENIINGASSSPPSA